MQTAHMEHMQKLRWAGHGSDWPDGYRPCMKCNTMKPVSEFHKHKKCKGGYNSVCKTCRVPLSKQSHIDRSPERRIFDSAKSRAAIKGREFNIDLEDIHIPDYCPVFLTPMIDPSIDRIDSEKGYIKGNIRIISRRANLLKNNASVEEMTLILADLIRIRELAGVCELI